MVICLKLYPALWHFLAGIGTLIFQQKDCNSELLCDVHCSLVYFISAVASPICGFGIDQLGRNIFWLLIGVIITMVCHGVLAFTFLTPFVPMVYNYYMVLANIHLLSLSLP